MSKIIKVEYKNWRGETRERLIQPIKIWYGSTFYHQDEQWLMTAYDCEDWSKEKDFALKDMKFLNY